MKISAGACSVKTSDSKADGEFVFELSYAMRSGERQFGSRTIRSYVDGNDPDPSALARMLGVIMAELVRSVGFDTAGDGIDDGRVAAELARYIEVPDKTDFAPVVAAAVAYLNLRD